MAKRLTESQRQAKTDKKLRIAEDRLFKARIKKEKAELVKAEKALKKAKGKYWAVRKRTGVPVKKHKRS